jgi:hypothetical protein
MTSDCGRDQVLSDLGRLAGSHGEADDVAGVDVEDHVAVVVDPAGWAAELGDVPAPYLPRCGGE